MLYIISAWDVLQYAIARLIFLKHSSQLYHSLIQNLYKFLIACKIKFKFMNLAFPYICSPPLYQDSSLFSKLYLTTHAHIHNTFTHPFFIFFCHNLIVASSNHVLRSMTPCLILQALEFDISLDSVMFCV